jgi:hypothetical protein
MGLGPGTGTEWGLSQQACLDGRPPHTIDIDPAVQHVAAAQAAIGWHHLFKGRFSQTWKQVQDQYLGPRKTKRNNGQSWLTKIINTLFQQWWILWELRNSDLHGRDNNTKIQSQSRQGMRELTQFYEAHKDSTPQHLQHLFTIPLLTRM